MTTLVQTGILSSCALLTLGACHGIGDALVDRRPVEEAAEDSSDCPSIPQCSDALALADSPSKELRLTPVDLHECGTLSPGCDGGVTRLDAPRSNCDVTFDSALESEVRLAKEGYACSALTIQVDEGQDELTLSGLRLQHGNLFVRATSPVSIVVDDATLADTWVGGDGPVSLEIRRSSLTNVGISLDHASSVAILEESSAQQLFVGDDGFGRSARVEIHRSDIDRGKLQASDLHVTSSQLQGVDVFASSAAIADTDAWSGTWDIRGVVAAARLEGLRINGCGDLTLVQSTVTRCVLSGCAEGMTRIYGSSVDRSVIDGPAQTKKARLSSLLIGVSAPTDLDAWDTSIRDTQFCRQSQTVRMGGVEARLECTACDERRPEELACRVGEVEVELRRNACASFEQMPECPESALDRGRASSH